MYTVIMNEEQLALIMKALEQQADEDSYAIFTMLREGEKGEVNDLTA